MLEIALGEVKITYLDKPYELSVSLHQMTLILLFNTVNSLTIKEMAVQTGLTISDILRSVKVTYYHGQ
jgi:DNA-binding MarR family transcriptional regulator